jgi:hypothetical protein
MMHKNKDIPLERENVLNEIRIRHIDESMMPVGRRNVDRSLIYGNRTFHNSIFRKKVNSGHDSSRPMFY